MRVACLFFASALATAQTPPPFDSRNTDIPDTDTHFIPKAFWRHASHGTLEQWEARKQFLRGQILSDAGLDPMPDRTPLNPRFVARMQVCRAERLWREQAVSHSTRSADRVVGCQLHPVTR